jgi:hypothetical protein
MAWFQRLARSPPSRPSYLGAREREGKEGAGGGLARATGVWGRGVVLEKAAAPIGGRLGEVGVRERRCKIW